MCYYKPEGGILKRHLQLNVLARADISWWHTFIEHWNGISLVPPATPAFFITSDASGTQQCGVLHYNQWLQPWHHELGGFADLHPMNWFPLFWWWLSGALMHGQAQKCAAGKTTQQWSGYQQRVSQSTQAYETASLFVLFFCTVYKIILTLRHLTGVQTPQQMCFYVITQCCSLLTIHRHLL